MEFEKYKKWGDYHWKAFENQESDYYYNVLKIIDWVKEKNVLDVGCGDGLITNLLGAKGIDDNQDAIKLAKKHSVDASLGTVYSLSGSYEAVLLADVLEHLDEPERALAEISKVTSKLYVVTPKRGKVLGNYHIQEWTMGELKKFLKKQGWVQISSELKDNRIYAVFTR